MGYNKKRFSKGRNADRKKKQNAVKKELSDYKFQLGSACQSSEYDEVSKYLINKIVETFTNYSGQYW